MTVALELDCVTRVYDGKAAVKDLTLKVGAGEFLALVGPSGCGKTTTLRLIAGLEEPDNGAVRIDQRDMTGVRPAERNIGFVFQHFALYPRSTAEENLTLPLLARGVGSAEARGQAGELAERLGLSPLLRRRVETLSGGEQQRVALGRALIRKPPILLLDEPLASLDVGLRASLRELLAEEHAREGMTIIYVTHDPLEMAALADRVAVVEHGSLVQAGSLSELSDDPRSLFIAQHVTLLPLNVASGTLINHGGRWSVDLKVGVYELQGTPNGATTGQPISWLLDPRSSRASAGTHHMVSRVVDTLGVRLARLNGDPPLWCAVDDAIQAGSRSMSPSTSKGFGFLRSQEQESG